MVEMIANFEVHWPTVVACLVLEFVGAYLYGFVKGCICNRRKHDS